MRTLLLISAALLVSAGCATSSFPRRPTAQEMANVEGLYKLEDGYRAHLFSLDSDLWIRIGAGSQKKLLMVGPNRFESPEGDVSIQFQPGWSGNVTQRVAVEYERPPGGHPPRMFSTGPRPGRGFLD